MIVKLKGGLGNQMFQYAFGRAVSLQKKYDLVFDISAYEENSTRDTKRTLALNKFNTKGIFVSEKKGGGVFTRVIQKIGHVFSPLQPYLFDKTAFENARQDSYFEGFWQNEEYFVAIADIIRNDFLPKELLSGAAERVHERIRVTNDPISLHIRRGDYIQDKRTRDYHGPLDLTYYKKAIDYLEEKIGCHFSIFVFSDDIEWAKTHMHSVVPSCAQIIYVSDNDIPDYEEILLMRTCKHHIIANSSFSWWGAWLNSSKNKIVIAPKQWVKNPSIDISQVTPPDWIKV